MDLLIKMFENKIVKEVIASLITLLIAIFLYSFFKNIINKVFSMKLKVLNEKVNDKKLKTLKSFITNIIRWVIIIITFIIILEIFNIDTSIIVTSFGAVTVVIGLAFQGVLKDIIAGISLIFENSYNIGDTVTINNFKGEVIYMGMKSTKIKAATGEVLIINNGSITEVINHTIENSLAVVDVSIAYEEDIDKTLNILKDLSLEMKKNIKDIKKINVLGVEDLAESSVVIRISAEVNSNTQYSVQREMRRYIKLELDKNNIVIPYNQLVIHNE